MLQAGLSSKSAPILGVGTALRAVAVGLLLSVAGRATAQIGASISPPQFSAPILGSPFPGATPIVSAVGVSLSKIDGSGSYGSVGVESPTVEGISTTLSDASSLTEPIGSDEPGRTTKLPVLSVSASSRRLNAGIPVGTLAGSSRAASVQVGTPSRMLIAPLGLENNRGLAVQSESARYSKLDALSPEVISNHRRTLTGGSYGPNPVSRLASSGGLFAFHPSITAPGVPRTRNILRTKPVVRSSSGRVHPGTVSRMFSGGKLPNSGFSVPKIPKVGIPNPMSPAPRF